MRRLSTLLAAVVLGAAPGIAAAQFTTTSPAGGALPGGVTVIGGVVADMIGLNGARVVSQLPATSLFVGFGDDGAPVGFRGNPLTIGRQTGYGASILDALGGGLTKAAFRITLYDGDTGPSDFDEGANRLLVNGIDIGDFSAVQTVRTSSTGVVIGSPSFGFGDDILSTGFFYTANATALSGIWNQLLATGTLQFGLFDQRNAYDNYFDFTQGIDGGLIDVGTPPIVTPPTAVPEPGTVVLLAAGLALLGVGGARRRTLR